MCQAQIRLAGPPAAIVTVPKTNITDIEAEKTLQKIRICVLAIGLDSLLASISNRQFSYHLVRTTDKNHRYSGSFILIVFVSDHAETSYPKRAALPR